MTNAEYARRWRLENAEKVRAYRKANAERRRSSDKLWKLKNTAKVKGYRKKYAQHSAQFAREWRKRNKAHAAQYRRGIRKEQRRAWDLLNRAISAGKLIRPGTCSKCKVSCIPEGHHPDYSAALNVIWLCKSCHKATHSAD